MQAVVVTSDYPDLYRFLAGLAGAYCGQAESAKLKGQTETHSEEKSVLVWSPGNHCNVFDSPEKLEIAEKHAQQLGAKIVLSAASNAPLREWGRRIGWNVLWTIPDLDRASAPSFSNFDDSQSESESEIAC